MKVVLLPQAQEDLNAIIDPLLSRVVRQLENLETFPEMGAAMTGPFLGWRSFVIEMFRIVYRVTTDKIQVAYVRDCRRGPLARP